MYFNNYLPVVTVHIVDFGNFEWWPTIVKSPLIGFLNLFQVFPEPEITSIFEYNKECNIDLKKKLEAILFLPY